MTPEEARLYVLGLVAGWISGFGLAGIALLICACLVSLGGQQLH